MQRIAKRFIVHAVLTGSLTVGGLSAGVAMAAEEIEVDPVVLVQDVGGQSVNVPVTAYFSLATKADGLHLDARLQANLQDLQAKFAAIVDSFPLPRGNCNSYKPDNLVVTIDRKSLDVGGETATIHLSGKVDVWSCLENPVPNSKIEWEMKQVGPIKTKVPVIKTSKGAPIKNKTLTQPFDASLPVRLERSGDRAIRLVLGTPEIKLKGPYAFITEGILKVANVDINREAHKALDRAVAPEKLLVAIPEEYAALRPVVTSAGFAKKNDKLVANIGLTANVPVEKVNEFVRAIVEHSKRK